MNATSWSDAPFVEELDSFLVILSMIFALEEGELELANRPS